jgi:hypothetical protein
MIKNKKRLLMILMAAIIALALVGCIKVNQTVTVNPDGSGTINIVMGVAKEYRSMVEQQGTTMEDAFKADTYRDQGFTVENFEDDKFVGIKMNKSYTNVEEMGQGGTLTFDLSDTDPKVLTVNGSVNAESSLEDQGMSLESLSGMENFEMTFEINLPSPATSHNATEELNGGRTLKWDLAKTQNIELQATLAGGGLGGMPDWIWYAVGGVVLLAIIVIIIVLLSRNSKRKAAADIAPTAYQPPAPAPAQPEVAPIPEPAAEPETQGGETDTERHIRETVEKYKND